MDVNSYQAQAAETMQFRAGSDDAKAVALLGLSGEVGELLTEYKKKIRDGDSYKIFRAKLVEELGDIIWYLSSVATLEEIALDEILASNLQKTSARWRSQHEDGSIPFEREFFDDGRPEAEKLPRELVAEFDEKTGEDGKLYAEVKVNDEPFGDPLRDNAYSDDYYRFHDVFHLSYAVILGWSPIARRFLKCKRQTDDDIDEVEDGGRASVVDEAISVLVFEYARDRNFLEGAGAVDYELLRTIKMLTRHLEVKRCTTKQWEEAILLGFEIWRALAKERKGRVICDLHNRTMVFEPLE